VSGVTGTNGKTTVAFLVRHLCDAAHHPCGLIGTVRYEIAGRILPAPHTTPEASELQDLLGQMVGAGCRAASMEVSSHALAQHRADAIDFDVCIFTNLTQDHLDFHGTMAAYFDAKTLLFAPPAEGVRKPRKAVVNLDDPYGAKLVARIGKGMPVVTYGLGARADFRASGIQQTVQGTTFHLEHGGRTFLVRLPLIGRFNVYNALAALAASHALGFDLRASVRAMADAPQVPGRLQAIPGRRRYQVYVDYAHTPDALANALRTLRELAPAGLITLFGCGGNRDRGKRPLMARAAAEGSDYTVLTSDNPRDEDPEAILREVAAGFPAGTRYEAIPDRAAAIRRAVALAGPQDVVLIAGKGHETTQEIAGRKIPFDDAEMAVRAIEERAAAEVGTP
jgi:UDP-N-acetylmuramoyl-L-alanyl-D-glutamate--2,6-diaminopimelate ligase